MAEIVNTEQAANWNSPTARSWWEHHALVDQLFDAFTEAALDLAAVKPGESALDIGCATGTTVIKLARRVGPAGRALGIDLTEQSVARGGERLASENLGNAEIVLGDATTHPFEPGAFDLAFSRFGIMFFADPIATFAHIRQALKPGGRALFIAFRRPEENPWTVGPRVAVADILPPEPPADPDAPSQFSWADPARVRRVLEGAGFASVVLRPHDPLIRLGRRDEALAFALRFGAIARAMPELGEADRQKVRERLDGYFGDVEGPDGIVLPGALWFVSARNP